MLLSDSSEKSTSSHTSSNSSSSSSKSSRHSKSSPQVAMRSPPHRHQPLYSNAIKLNSPTNIENYSSSATSSATSSSSSAPTISTNNNNFNVRQSNIQLTCYSYRRNCDKPRLRCSLLNCDYTLQVLQQVATND